VPKWQPQGTPNVCLLASHPDLLQAAISRSAVKIGATRLPYSTAGYIRKIRENVSYAIHIQLFDFRLTSLQPQRRCTCSKQFAVYGIQLSFFIGGFRTSLSIWKRCFGSKLFVTRRSKLKRRRSAMRVSIHGKHGPLLAATVLSQKCSSLSRTRRVPRPF